MLSIVVKVYGWIFIKIIREGTEDVSCEKKCGIRKGVAVWIRCVKRFWKKLKKCFGLL